MARAARRSPATTTICAVQILTRNRMTEEEAEEYLDFNVIGAYVGEMTPLFLHDLRASSPGHPPVKI
jgi:hypothetical protein